jgi:hypothetical protein
MEKKNYQAPQMEELVMDEQIMQTQTGEGGSSGTQEGEGGGDLSREIMHMITE